jgi:putative Mn2+ efflux pump MntP
VHFVLSKSQKRNESIKGDIIKIIKEQKPETTSELIKIVQQTTNLSEEEIINLLNQLEAEGKIQLNTKQELASVSIGNYLFSYKSAWYWTTIAGAIVTTTTVFTIPQDSFPLAYLRNILGVIFVLFLPGYAFIKAFFPVKVPIKTSSENLDNIERFALSIGMSLALTPIVGLILYYTPIGIGLTPITLSLLALTAVLATAAMGREYRAKSTTIQRTSEYY